MGSRTWTNQHYDRSVKSHLALPWQGHMEQVFHIFSYLAIRHNTVMVFNPSYPEFWWESLCQAWLGKLLWKSQGDNPSQCTTCKRKGSGHSMLCWCWSRRGRADSPFTHRNYYIHEHNADCVALKAPELSQDLPLGPNLWSRKWLMSNARDYDTSCEWWEYPCRVHHICLVTTNLLFRIPLLQNRSSRRRATRSHTTVCVNLWQVVNCWPLMRIRRRASVISWQNVYLAASVEPSWSDDFYMTFECVILQTSCKEGGLNLFYSRPHGRREMLFVVLYVEAISQDDRVP